MKALLNSKLNHKPLTASRVLLAALLTIVLLLPAVAIHATATEATAKNDTGHISGKVLEPGRGGVPGASVALIDSRTLKRIFVTTGEDGSFEFPTTPSGKYEIEVSKAGFTAMEIPDLDLKPSGNLIVVTTISQMSEGKLSALPHAQGHRPHRIRIGGQVEANKLIYHVSPKYPPLAKAAGIQGKVMLEAIIAKNGTVKDLKVLSGRPLLVKAALDAVRNWRYKPTLLKGVPVEVATTINVNFGLAK